MSNKPHVIKLTWCVKMERKLLTRHTPASPTHVAVLVLDCHHSYVAIESCAACSSKHLQSLLELEQVVTNFIVAFGTLKPSFTTRCLEHNLNGEGGRY
jgi:hypothetical protein